MMVMRLNRRIIMSSRNYQRKLYSLLLAVFILLLSSLQLFAVAKDKIFVPLEHVKTNDNDIELYLHKKSLDIDLLKTKQLRLKVQVKELYKQVNERTSSFRINAYDINDGVRKFVSSQNITINRAARRSRLVNIDAGYFSTATKNIEFDLIDTANNLVNT